MNIITLLLVLLAAILIMLDWRKGLMMVILMGIAQDPLRKLAAGQSIVYVLLAAGLFGVTWARAGMARIPLGPSSIQGWRENFKVPFTVFTILVCLQAAQSLARYDSLLMPAIGMLVWLSPIPAVVFGYQFAVRRGLPAVKSLMVLYIVVALIALSGVYFEYAGFDWRTLGEIGEGQIIYDMGTTLKAHSGFFRASEIAAWHTATAACFIFLLSVGKRATLPRVVTAIVLICVIVTLGILTGRRKMLVEIAIFLSTYFFLVAWLQRGLARVGVVVLAAGVVCYIGIVGFISPDLVAADYTKSMHLSEKSSRLEGYTERGKSVIVDLPARVSKVGFSPVIDAIDTFGWLGAGLGTGSQGTNQIAEKYNLDRGVAEGGLGKVAMELGVPGLIVIGWLMVAFGRHLREQLAIVTSLSVQHTRIAFGMLAFIVANIATFSVATQAYSDPFILLLLGLSVGFLLAMAPLSLAETARAAWRRQGAAEAQPPFAATVPGPTHRTAP